MNANTVVCPHPGSPCRTFYNTSELVCAASSGTQAAAPAEEGSHGAMRGCEKNIQHVCHPRHFLRQSQGRWWENAGGKQCMWSPWKECSPRSVLCASLVLTTAKAEPPLRAAGQCDGEGSGKPLSKWTEDVSAVCGFTLNFLRCKLKARLTNEPASSQRLSSLEKPTCIPSAFNACWHHLTPSSALTVSLLLSAKEGDISENHCSVCTPYLPLFMTLIPHMCFLDMGEMRLLIFCSQCGIEIQHSSFIPYWQDSN